MEENLSWRAKLAKANINILSITMEKTSHGVVYKWFFEFTYHPKAGVFKWCKTYLEVPQREYGDDEAGWFYTEYTPEEVSDMILAEVLKLRKELED